MNQQMTNDPESRNHRLFHVLPVGVFVTVCVIIGVSAASFEGPVTLMSSTHADAVWPIGPADSQVAERYGRIDYSSLNSPDIPLEPNPAPGATIAAYEMPPE